MQVRPHINLEVADLKASIQFYSLVFRMSPTKQRQDYANYRLESPGLHLALEYRPDRVSGNPFPNQHFGIELFDNEDLVEWRTWLQNVGVNYRVEEHVTCCYAVADKFWLTDPDGHRWEFWVRTDEADLMHGETVRFAQGSAVVECCAPTSQSILAEAEAKVEAKAEAEGQANDGQTVAEPSCGTSHNGTAVEVKESAPPSSCCG